MDCVHQSFANHARTSPERIAIIDGQEKLTYGELETRANKLARRLRAWGITREVPVALCMDRCADLVVAMLGVLKAGGAYVPIDPAYPDTRKLFMVRDAGAAVVIVGKEYAELFRPSGARPLLSDDPEILSQSSEPLDSAVCPELLAYAIYTSGSTGQPKGALVTHGNLARLFTETAAYFHFEPSDVWTFFHSAAFDFSVWEIWGALVHGGTIVIVPYMVSRSPHDFHALVSRERVTVLNQTPSAFQQFMVADEASKAALALRLVIFGGEALDLATLRPWFDRHGDAKPQLVNMFGITETTVHVTYRPLVKADTQSSGSMIGQPMPDLRVSIEEGSGEMFVSGGGVCRGYLGRPELTAERFVPDPEGPSGSRRYKTGDSAKKRSGDIEYTGRIDHQVKIRGFRIELGEVEAAIVRTGVVRQAVAILRDDGGEKQIVAYVTPSTLSISKLREALAPLLPEYMIPQAFVALDVLPLTTSGKVDRRALPAPGKERATDTEYVTPGGGAEDVIARLWEELLGIDKVGLTDDFYDLGGHSLVLIQLAARIEQELGVRLPLHLLFDAPTVREMAALAGSMKPR